MSISIATFATTNIALTSFHALTAGHASVQSSARLADVGYSRAANYLVTGLTSVAVILGVGAYVSPTSVKGSSATAELFEPVVIRSSLPLSFQEAQAEMDSFRKFEAGWDGPDSVRPMQVLIDAATNFLSFLPATAIAPEASASADGAVSWFWDTDDFYATVSFSKPGKYAYFAKSKRSGNKTSGISETFLSEIPEDFLGFISLA